MPGTCSCRQRVKCEMGSVPFCKARLKAVRFVAARAGYACGLTVLLLLFGSRALQNAVAEGDTRTISLHHIHTDEDITITFKRDGRYDEAALEKLNWFLRDWRKDEADQDGPAPDRPGVGGAARGRHQGADLGGVRLSLAGDQRHAAPPQLRRGALQPAHARPRHGFLHSRRAARTAARHRACGCSAAASASIRPPARRSSTWIPAACGIGRA